MFPIVLRRREGEKREEIERKRVGHSSARDIQMRDNVQYMCEMQTIVIENRFSQMCAEKNKRKPII